MVSYSIFATSLNVCTGRTSTAIVPKNFVTAAALPAFITKDGNDI